MSRPLLPPGLVTHMPFLHKLSTFTKALGGLCFQKETEAEGKWWSSPKFVLSWHFLPSNTFIFLYWILYSVCFQVYLARQFSTSHASLGMPLKLCVLLCVWRIIAAPSQVTGGTEWKKVPFITFREQWHHNKYLINVSPLWVAIYLYLDIFRSA